MGRIVVEVVIDAAPDVVWDDLRDISRHVEWMHDAVAIRFTSEQREGVGTAFDCETAVGPTIGQEGVLNVARAFLVGGASSVMMTLWPVSDAISAALMRQFYDHLVRGDDVSESLRASKRAVLDRFGPESMATIAAFQIVGDGAQRIGKPRTSQTVGGR